MLPLLCLYVVANLLPAWAQLTTATTTFGWSHGMAAEKVAGSDVFFPVSESSSDTESAEERRLLNVHCVNVSIPCTAPIYIPNGLAGALCEEGKTIMNAGRCTPQCKEGYSPSVSALWCDWGDLKPSTFTCGPAPCNAPDVVNSPLPSCLEGGSVSHGSSCTPTCYPGYSPTSASLTCSFGQLSQPFNCTPTPCTPPQVINAMRPACREGMVIEHATICSTQCNEPLVAVPELLVCINGNFTPDVFRCESVQGESAPCTSPLNVPNAAADACLGGFVSSGTNCVSRCSSGFTPVPSSLSCQDGNLTPSAFHCAEDCTAPLNIQDAASPACRQGASIAHGTSCTAACAPGLVAQPPEVTCDDGMLSSSFTCTRPLGNSCSAPSGIIHGSDPCVEGQEIFDGGICSTQCAIGYAPSVASLSCADGDLAPSTFMCVDAPCPIPTNVVQALPNACQETQAPQLESGIRCTTQCAPGYVPSPTAMLCMQGSFTPTTFECLAWDDLSIQIGPTPQDLVCKEDTKCALEGLDGVAMQNGDTVMLLSSCGNAGVTLVDKGFPGVPILASDCATKYSLSSGLLYGTAQMCWCSAAIDCKSDPAKYSRTIGTLRVVCREGFYLKNGKCLVSSCPAPQGVQGAPEQTCGQGPTIPHGGICSARCLGTDAPSPFLLRCINGSLNPSTFACVRPVKLPCPAPRGISKSQNPACVEGPMVTSGANCTTLCATGYKPLPDKLLCVDGVLFPEQFKCVEAPCPMPVGIPQAAQQSCDHEDPNATTLNSGATCEAQCLAGHLPFPRQLQCSRGTFEPASFSCLEWLNQQAIARSGFGPRRTVNKRCTMDSECNLENLQGEGLRNNDQVMLLSECGSRGQPLPERGLPASPIGAVDCGFTIPFGRFTREATRVGFAEMCYCPAGIDCGTDSANFWKRLGTLELRCPATGNPLGWYTVDGMCMPCNENSGAECGLCEPLKKFNIEGENVCSCDPGYYKTADNRCEPCGRGFFCPGPPAALRMPCDPGSSTKSRTAKRKDECLCDRGYMPELNVTLNKSICVMCMAGYYKQAIANEPCTSRCMANGHSEPGAQMRTDCFCMKSFYYMARTGTCDMCPGPGAECVGGFINGSDKVHEPPRALPGNYMTAYDEVTACEIVATQSGNETTVCLGGPYAESDAACLTGHTGIVCGACAPGWARDGPKMQCVSCENVTADGASVVAAVNFEIMTKAAAGLFLASRAMRTAKSAGALDAVILRVWLQWLACTSLLGTFDMSKIELYSWSVDARKVSKASVLSNSTASTPSNSSGDPLLPMPAIPDIPDVNFNWPPWFQNIFQDCMIFSALFQATLLGSTNERLECYFDDPDKSPTEVEFTKVFWPTVYWALFPLFVMFWLLILSIILAKCAYPIYFIFVSRAMLKALRMAGGYDLETAAAKVEKLGETAMTFLMEDPAGVFKNPSKIIKVFGKLTTYEIIAHQICMRLGDMFEDEKQIVAALATMDAGPELLKTFLYNPQSGMEKLGEIAQTAAQNYQDIFDQLEEEEDAYNDRDECPAYAVFGLFGGTGICDIIMTGLLPAILVTTYSNWDMITTRLLMAVQMESYKVGVDGVPEPEPQMRVALDPRLQGHSGMHLAISAVAYLGLFFWSVGFLFFVAASIWRKSDQLQELETLRSFGYFYNGCQSAFWWWEIIVKKMDVLFNYLVTYVQLFVDVKSKLALWSFSAGITWALHGAVSPFDQRSNQLVDRVEALGLRTRFLSLFLVQLLLLNDASIVICIIAGVALLLVTLQFNIIMALTFFNETGAFDDAESGSGKSVDKDAAAKKLNNRMPGSDGGGDDDGNCLKALGRKLFKLFMLYVGKFIISFIMNVVLWPFKWGARVKTELEGRVPHLVWHGLNTPVQIVDFKDGYLLKNRTTKKYLATDEEGELSELPRFSLRNWRNWKKTPSIFEISVMDEDDGSSGDEGFLANGRLPVQPCIVRSETGTFEAEEVEPQRGVRVIRMGDDFYNVFPVKKSNLVARFLRSLIQSHYKLGPVDQRRYVARTMSNVISHLLVEGNISVIPDSINDFLCLLPLSIRKLRDDGGTLELGKEDCQQTLLKLMQDLIQQKNEEERKIIDILATANFTHAENTHAFTPDYAVTPEEIMEAITVLCRLNKQNVAKFLGQCMGLIGAEEAKAVQRHQEASTAHGWMDGVPGARGVSPKSQNGKLAFVEKKGPYTEHFPPPPNVIEDLDGPTSQRQHFPVTQNVDVLEDSDGVAMVDPNEHRTLALPNAVESSEGEDAGPPAPRGPQRPSQTQPPMQLPAVQEPRNGSAGSDFKGVLP